MQSDTHLHDAGLLAGRYRRLAPGWRLLVWLACVAVAWAGWGGALVAAGLPLEALWRPDLHPWGQKALLGGAYASLLSTTAWCWVVLQGRPLVALTGPPACWRAAGGWFLAGLASLALLQSLMLGLGLAEARPPAVPPMSPTLWGDVLAAAWLFAVSEELVFRGFVLRTLAEAGAWRLAVAGSAACYASAHFLKLDAGWQAVALPWLGLFTAGLMFGWLTLRTGALWAASGLHAGWVALFLASDRMRVLDPRPDAHLWTGGGYPLGGLLGLAAVLCLWAGTAWMWRHRKT
jgi:membrane protease YdiL (CAAX protease family)